VKLQLLLVFDAPSQLDFPTGLIKEWSTWTGLLKIAACFSSEVHVTVSLIAVNSLFHTAS